MSTTPAAAAPSVTEVTFEIVPKDVALPPDKKELIIQSFSPLLAKARELLDESKGITSAKLARVSRLQFRKLRGDSEDLRKSSKEMHLLMGRAIDGAHAILVAAVTAEEKRMEEIEKAEERKEEARVEALRQQRHDALVGLGVHETIVNSPGLGRMDDAAFDKMHADFKEAHEARLKREQEEADAKLKKDLEEAQEKERLRLENERLLKEAKQREAEAKAAEEKAAKEKAALEAKLAAERAEADKKAEYERQVTAQREKEAADKAKREKDELEAKHKADQAAAQKKLDDEKAAREKLENEQREREEAAAKKKQEDEAAAEAALLAPDKDKLKALATAIRAVAVPKVKSKKANTVLTQIITKLSNLSDWVEEKAEEL